MARKSISERYSEYTAQLSYLHQREQIHQTEGDEISLRIVRQLIQKLRGEEREYNKHDIMAYMEKVSGEPDYPHSLRTALPEFLELLNDD